MPGGFFEFREKRASETRATRRKKTVRDGKRAAPRRDEVAGSEAIDALEARGVRDPLEERDALDARKVRDTLGAREPLEARDALDARDPAAAPRRGAGVGATTESSTQNNPIWTVSELTNAIDRALKDGFPQTLHIRGEVSNFSHHRASGHLYFTLKDAGCCVDCVMWKSDATKLKFTPTDGLALLVSARVGVYGQRGRYQLYVSRMQPLGAGALELAFNQLKSKLEAEGLFAPERKRPLPRYPLRIALVTGQNAAGLADMLKVLGAFPFIKILLVPVPVQGASAAPKIAQAIAHLNARRHALGGIDLAIVGRGGGSLEDLWAFNEEVVARAIAASAIPIVSGIGHEVDVSIADLVADHHAHTPTEAARVVCAAWRTAENDIGMLGARARRAIRMGIGERRSWLNGIGRAECFRRPMERIHRLGQGLDDRQRELAAVILEEVRRRREALGDLQLRLERHRPSAVLDRRRQSVEGIRTRLNEGMRKRWHDAERALSMRVNRLQDLHPKHGVERARWTLATVRRQLDVAILSDLKRRMSLMESTRRQLNAVGPRQVLARGYSITTLKRGGGLVKTIADVRRGDRLVTRLVDGSIESTAEDPNQPGLFE